MSAKDKIKYLIFKEGTTIKKVAEEYSKKYEKLSANGITQRLSRCTLRFEEAEKIADILGYDIEFKKR